MNVLTKLFVSLMIILSLLLTGAVVVFVNRVEDYRRADTEKASEIARVRSERDSAKAEAAATSSRASEDARTLNTTVARLNETVAQNQKEKFAVEAQLSQKTKENAILTAGSNASSQALASINETLKGLQANYDALVKANSELRNRIAEVSGVNTDLDKRNAEFDRALKFAQEQLVQYKADKDRLERLVKENKLDPSGTAVAIVTAPDLKGVIKAIRPQNGQVLATISLGSADRVEKGMRFIVASRGTDKFLAILRIDVVDSNEAIGQLLPDESPAIAEVVAGSPVVTQLR